VDYEGDGGLEAVLQKTWRLRPLDDGEHPAEREEVDGVQGHCKQPNSSGPLECQRDDEVG
jgi:hypothetical protein